MDLQEKTAVWEKWANAHFAYANATLSTVPGIEKNHGAVWHARRCVTVTGTDIAAIAGESKYKSALEVFNSKLLRVNFDDFARENIRFDVGNALESVCGKWVAKLVKGAITLINGGYTKFPEINFNHLKPDNGQLFAQSIARPWSRSQLDDYIHIPGLGYGVVECKTSDHPKFVGFGDPCVIANGKIAEYSSQVPVYYLLQAHKEMADAHEDPRFKNIEPDFAVIVLMEDFSNLPKLYFIPYDAELHAAINDVADDFMFNHLIPGIEPELTTDESALKFAKVAVSDPKSYASNDEARGIALNLASVKEQIKALTETQKALENQLKTMIGENAGVKTGDEVIATWISRRVFNEELLAQEKPEIYQAYQKTEVVFDKDEFKANNKDLYDKYLLPSTTRTLTLKVKAPKAA